MKLESLVNDLGCADDMEHLADCWSDLGTPFPPAGHHQEDQAIPSNRPDAQSPFTRPPCLKVVSLLKLFPTSSTLLSTDPVASTKNRDERLLTLLV